MSTTGRREVVVVGAGLIGLSVAAELARRGRDVLCLEQAQVGHEWSGSKGDARIFRLGYDDPLYVDLARRCVEGWAALASAAGQALLVPCGLVSVGEGLEELAAAMETAGGAPELLDAGQLAARFPGLAVRGAAVLDPGAGVLLADRVLAALAATPGLELRAGAAVSSISERGSSVVVSLTEAGEEVVADMAIVCAGPSTAPLLATAGVECRLSPTLEQVAYFDVPGAGWTPSLPALAWRGAGGAGTEAPERLAVYGLPAPARGWYKLGLHHAGPPAVPGVTPLEADAELTERLVAAARAVLADVGGETRPVLLERCVYDNTADGDFVLDRAGRIVVGAGTSGHGFKFGPVLGRLLADLALDEEPELDLARFAMQRPALAGAVGASEDR